MFVVTDASSSVVYRLLRGCGVLGRFHRVFTDSAFTSIPLIERLLHEDTYLCGTFMPTRKHFPQEFRKKGAVKALQLKRGDYGGCFLVF